MKQNRKWWPEVTWSTNRKCVWWSPEVMVVHLQVDPRQTPNLTKCTLKYLWVMLRNEFLDSLMASWWCYNDVIMICVVKQVRGLNESRLTNWHIPLCIWIARIAKIKVGWIIIKLNRDYRVSVFWGHLRSLLGRVRSNSIPGLWQDEDL